MTEPPEVFRVDPLNRTLDYSRYKESKSDYSEALTEFFTVGGTCNALTGLRYTAILAKPDPEVVVLMGIFDGNSVGVLKVSLGNGKSQNKKTAAIAYEAFGEGQIISALSKQFGEPRNANEIPVVKLLPNIETCSVEHVQKNAGANGNTVVDLFKNTLDKDGKTNALGYTKKGKISLDKAFVMIPMSAGRMSLVDFISVATQPGGIGIGIQHILNVFIQVCMTLHELQVGLRFCHFDLHCENISLEVGPAKYSAIKCAYHMGKEFTLSETVKVASEHLFENFSEAVPGTLLVKLIDFGRSFISAGKAMNYSLSPGYSHLQAVHNKPEFLGSTLKFYPAHDIYRMSIDFLYYLETRANFLLKFRGELGQGKPSFQVVDEATSRKFIALMSMIFRDRQEGDFTVAEGLIDTEKQNLIEIGGGDKDATAKNLKTAWGIIKTDLTNALAGKNSFEQKKYIAALALLQWNFASSAKEIDPEDIAPYKILDWCSENGFGKIDGTSSTPDTTLDWTTTLGPATKTEAEMLALYNA